MDACETFEMDLNAPEALPEKRCYSVEDLQIILGIGRKSVYELLKKNEFRWFRIGGGHYRISRKSFDEWLDRRL